MPELPEVQTIVGQLSRALRGRRIIELAWWDNAKALRPSPKTVAAAVREQKIRRVRRCAKLILIELWNGATIAIHLKLTGRLLLRAASAPSDPYTHTRFALDRGDELRFADVRKFGYIRVVRDQDELDRLFGEYGPEPLTAAFTAGRLAAILRGCSTKIKPLLMDQARISGIGNIYSDEALFDARIDPRRMAKSLSSEEARRLHQGIVKVLRAGIRHHGTSDQWYVDAHGRPGTHQNCLRVYGRAGEPCPKCKTPIKRAKFGGRSGHFCPRCQK